MNQADEVGYDEIRLPHSKESMQRARLSKIALLVLRMNAALRDDVTVIVTDACLLKNGNSELGCSLTEISIVVRARGTWHAASEISLCHE